MIVEEFTYLTDDIARSMSFVILTAFLSKKAVDLNFALTLLRK